MQGRHSGSETGKETSHHQFTFSSWKSSFAVAGAHVLVGSHAAFWGVLGSWACPLALVYLSMKAQRFPFLPTAFPEGIPAKLVRLCSAEANQKYILDHLLHQSHWHGSVSEIFSKAHFLPLLGFSLVD